MAEIRSRLHRAPVTTSSKDPLSAPSVGDNENKVKSDHSLLLLLLLRGRHWFLFIVFNAFLLLYIHRKSSVFPAPLTLDTAPPGRFVEERARRSLDGITGLGSRPVGSVENEVLAVQYLVQEIEAVQRTVAATTTQHVHTLEYDVQKVSGFFDMDFLGGFTTVYENINNVIVKLSPSR